MKYNININQLALSETNLDLKDSAILDYLIFYCNSKNEKIEKQRIDGYTWINYKSLIDDMPLLRVTARGSITPRIKKLKEAGFIKTKKVIRKGHQFLYLKLTSLTDSLFAEAEKPVHETEREQKKPVHEAEKPVHETEPIIINTYNNTNIVETSSTKKKNDSENPMNLQEFVKSLKKPKTGKKPQYAILIIAEWAETIKPKLNTKGKWHVFLKRNLKPANDLRNFTLEEIEKFYIQAKNDSENSNGFSVTLETLIKYSIK